MIQKIKGLLLIMVMVLSMTSALADVPVIETIDGQDVADEIIVDVIEGIETIIAVTGSDADGDEFRFTIADDEGFENVNVNGDEIRIVADAGEENADVTVRVIDVNDDDENSDASFTINVLPVLDVVDLRVGKQGGNLVAYQDGNTTEEFVPGDTVVFQVTVQNKYTAEHHELIDNGEEPIIVAVGVEPQADEALGEAFPEVVDGPNGPIFLNAGERETFNLQYQIPLDTEDGQHRVTFSVSGADLDRHEYTSSISIDLDVDLRPNDIRLVATALDVEQPITCDRKQAQIQVRTDLANAGVAGAQDVTVQVLHGDDLLVTSDVTLDDGVDELQVAQMLNLENMTGDQQLTVRAFNTHLPPRVYGTETIDITVANCAPEAVVGFPLEEYDVDEDETLEIELDGQFTDVEGHDLLFALGEVDEDVSGTSLDGTTLRIVPDANFFSADGETERVTLLVSDGIDETPVQFNIVVNQLADEGLAFGDVSPAGDVTLHAHFEDQQEQTFTVEVQNPDDIAVEYTWTLRDLDGNNDPVDLNNNNEDITLSAAGDDPLEVGTYELKVLVNEGEDEEISRTWEVTIIDRPLGEDSFAGDETTEIAAVADPTSVNGFTLETNNGKIEWLNAVDISEIVDLSAVVTITSTSVNVDSETAPGLNERARITLQNTFENPVITRDGELCAANVCEIVADPAEGTFVFTVTGFSEYVVGEAQEAALSVSAIEFDNVNLGAEDQTVDVTVTNTGSSDAITNLAIALENVDAKYGATIVGNLADPLGPGASTTVQLQIDVPENEDGGRHSIGTLKVTGENAGEALEDSSEIFLDTQSLLEITKFEVNDGDDFSISESSDIEVEITNNLAVDLEDVEVTVTIDVDGDDKDESSDEEDVDAGDDQDFKIEFDLSGEDMDSETFEVIVEVVGEDENNVEYRTVETFTGKLDLERHKVVFSRVSLSATSLQCSRQTNVEVIIKNEGESSEDEVEVRVTNSELGLNLVRDEIDIEEYTDNNNDERETFRLDFTGKPAGSYPINVELYNDGDHEETETVTLTIAECGGSAPVASQTASQGQNSFTGQDRVAQLQAELNRMLQASTAQAQAVEQPSNKKVVTSFRDSNMYVGLLGGLVVLTFIAMLLAMAVLLRRK